MSPIFNNHPNQDTNSNPTQEELEDQALYAELMLQHTLDRLQMDMPTQFQNLVKTLIDTQIQAMNTGNKMFLELMKFQLNVLESMVCFSFYPFLKVFLTFSSA